MEFTFDTVYDQKAVTAMANGLRKTIRKKHSRRSHIIGWIVIVLALLLTIPQEGEALVVSAKTIVTWAAALVMFLTLIFEDSLNAWIARRRMLEGTDHAVSLFTPNGYTSETGMGNTEWHYENIKAIAEDGNYFIFVFDKRHAQVYAKQGMKGGTAEEFRGFIADVTGIEVQMIG